MELDKLRTEIDGIDEEMAELFKKRMAVSEKIAAEKEKQGLPTLDLAREEQVLKQAEERCGIYGREFFKKIMDLSKKYQSSLRAQKK